MRVMYNWFINSLFLYYKL